MGTEGPRTAEERLEEQARRYAVLEDPTRRAAYLAARRAGRPVTREDVAGLLGVSRALAAFHLERLLDAGLLTADHARPAGRGGPGAGRPAKRYRPAPVDIAIEIPPRGYALAGRLLARAVATPAARGSARAEALRLAADEGRRLGQQAGGACDGARVEAALVDLGFEPVVEDAGRITLANCPFHALVAESGELVCHMNEALVGGLLSGLGCADYRAVLAPGDGRCCVLLEPGGRGRAA